MIRQDTVLWAQTALVERGYKLKSNEPENIKNTPWSSVSKFETDKGSIYLKQMPEEIALEPDVLRVLKEKFSTQVPDVIARNKELHCFLMKDAGRPLREKLQHTFDSRYLCDAVERFSAIQLDVANHLNLFFEIGVPDWRLSQLPNLYHEVVNDSDLLLSEGLSINQIDELKNLQPKILEYSRELAGYSIPVSIIQPDFHDNNVLIDGSGKLTFIDLGEILISHPFFPLFNYLWQVTKHHGLKEGDVEYEKIKHSCFYPYRKKVGSGDLLHASINIAEKLNCVYVIVYQYRFMKICGKSLLIKANQWKLRSAINDLIEIMR